MLAYLTETMQNEHLMGKCRLDMIWFNPKLRLDMIGFSPKLSVKIY